MSLDRVWGVRTAGIALLAVLITGCVTAGPPGRRDSRASAQGAAASRPAEPTDQFAGHAGSMAEEDARRTPAASDLAPRQRPDPIRQTPRSPVDQPRLR